MLHNVQPFLLLILEFQWFHCQHHKLGLENKYYNLQHIRLLTHIHCSSHSKDNCTQDIYPVKIHLQALFHLK